MTICYIGMGANLASPAEQLQRAFSALDSAEQCQLLKRSGLYASKPMGDVAQPDYVNAVAEISTELDPIDLLDTLQQIELSQGRTREIRWGPRTLDLDLLLYGDQNVEHPRLVVPHYGLTERRFVVEPLLELNPELKLPNGSLLRDYSERLSCPPLIRISD
ncbi:2-amino-4-hydroxy-6-hydroxymethyldihydropteridine diphosphokinase [Paraferrimonas sedimenticola]|uniref:2-amino-4-hydroxy-6-hydroxymethyldihydropteridine pyrophosphokinase n=1 Tax=Paraferrimonas sedimenticola TaxID=375674 RepID=A0AA37RUQ6_9GAMM|nr:2-amino-4-hydroxy-6-hydroxymethyldihydropteridine diphosphokinase [Paraferrimonas sedimenticola]GLP95631.1 2-amino-4-hydroxy-6-hydroxymethyldihydropteridine diphosphokinase [Paraferrimonas sedimenticola]